MCCMSVMFQVDETTYLPHHDMKGGEISAGVNFQCDR